MNTPLISVVMAVYNALPFLSQALDSILAQTLTDFELIVIDDASTDGSLNALSCYTDPRLIILKNDQNIGLTRSLNIGLSQARGRFIARHDADDISDPDRFRQQIALFERNPSLGLIGSNHYIIDRQNQILDTVQNPGSNEELQALLVGQNCFCHGSVMFRNSCIHRVGAYREQFPVTQDYDLWLRIAEHFELANLPEFLYQFRFHTDAISQNKIDLQLSHERLAHELAKQRRSNGQEKIPENVLDAYPPDPQRIFNGALLSAYYLFASGDVNKAKFALQAAINTKASCTISFSNWETWIVAEARHLAVSHNQAKDGEEFIKWAYLVLSLPNGKKSRRFTLGHFYADQAFLKYRNKKHKEVVRNAYSALINDRNWLKNRGLLSITFKSLINLMIPFSSRTISRTAVKRCV